MTSEVVSPSAAETAGLVLLLHRLHDLSVRLVTGQPGAAEVTREVVALLDAVAPLVSTLRRVAPAVLDTLGALDQVRDVAALTTELVEAHRVLRNGLHDHDIDPGRPAVPVYDLLRQTLSGGVGTTNGPAPH